MILLVSCAAPSPSPASTPPVPLPAAPSAPRPPEVPPEGPFRLDLADGITLAGYDPPDITDLGYNRPDPGALARTDPRIFVVTVDLARYELGYLSVLDASLPNSAPMTAERWAERFDLLVAFNPGMFEPDGRATGYTRSASLTSQPRVRRNKLYRAWFLADPLEAAAPPAVTLDQIPPKGEGLYADLEALPRAIVSRLSGYRLVSQSLAVLRAGAPVYPPRESQWSELAYGTDEEGRLVVVFSRYPYEMRELGARVAALGLGIDGLLHGEGGPEASLVVRAGGLSLALCGSYETGFFDDSNDVLWSLPAVMGVRAKRPGG